MLNSELHPSSLEISGIMIPDISKRTIFYAEIIQAIQKLENKGEYYNFLKRIDFIGKYQSSDYPTKMEGNIALRAKIALRVIETISSSELYDTTEGNADTAMELLLSMNLQQLKDIYARSREKVLKIRGGLESKFMSNISELTKIIPLPEIFKERIEYAGVFNPLFGDSDIDSVRSVKDYKLYHDIFDNFKTFGNKQISLFPLSLENYPSKIGNYPSIKEESKYLRDSIEHYQLITKISSSGLLLVKYGVPDDFYEEIMQKYCVRSNASGVFHTIEDYIQKFKLDIIPLIFRYYITRFLDQKYRLGIKEGYVFPSKDHLMEISDWISILTNQDRENMIAEFVNAIRRTELMKDSEYKVLENFFHDWIVSQFQIEIKRISDFSILPQDENEGESDIRSSEYIEGIGQEVKKLDRILSIDDYNEHISQLQQSYDINMAPMAKRLGIIFSQLSQQDAESKFYDLISTEMTSTISGTYYEVHGSLFSMLQIAELLIGIHTNIKIEVLCRMLMRFILDQQAVAGSRRITTLLYILGFDFVNGCIIPNKNINTSLLSEKITNMLRNLCMNSPNKLAYSWYKDYRDHISQNISKELKRDAGLKRRISDFIINEMNAH